MKMIFDPGMAFALSIMGIYEVCLIEQLENYLRIWS